MFLTLILLVAIGISMFVNIYAIKQWNRISIERDIAASYAEKYHIIRYHLSRIESPPKVCKLCSTIGGQHYVDCPYMVVNFALYKAEQV